MAQQAAEAVQLANADETFPERLRRWRTRMGLNQGEFAKELGVLRNTAGRWERGDQTPSIAQLAAIAALTEQTMDYWAEPFIRYQDDEL